MQAKAAISRQRDWRAALDEVLAATELGDAAVDLALLFAGAHYSEQYDELVRAALAVGAATGLLLFGFSLIAPRLSYVQCRPTHLRVSTPLFQLAISYSRIHTARPVPFVKTSSMTEPATPVGPPAKARSSGLSSLAMFHPLLLFPAGPKEGSTQALKGPRGVPNSSGDI